MENKKIKKLSIVVYCNGDFYETKETLYSIIDQKLSNLFYEVFILNDNSQKDFHKKLNDFIKKEELSNFHIYSLDGYNGLPISFNFLILNNIIKTKYFTIIKSGDLIKEDWFNYFLDNLYFMDQDLYISDLKQEYIVSSSKIEDSGKKHHVYKSKIILSSVTGQLTKDEVICTMPVFLGKIWKTEKVLNINITNDRILFQTIYMFFQMVLRCEKIWYEGMITGVIKHKPWIPEKMDQKRIELLNLTLNKCISRNPYLNGHVLQLLALAIQNTDNKLKPLYLLTNHKYLQNNIIIPIYNLSRKKVLKITKPIIEFGEYKLQKTKDEIKKEKIKAKQLAKEEKMKRKNKNVEIEDKTKEDDFVLENESYKIEKN